METKHTKGEWVVDKRASTRVHYNDITIASCGGGQNDIELEEQQSNAKLISAAPDLLEALVNICKKVEFCSLDNKSTFKDEYKKAINAINKASK